MTCAEVKDRLDDYVDGELAEAEFQEIELHLQDCRACREEERTLRALLAHAAALPAETEPGRDLWPGIAARISRRRVLAFRRSPAWAPVGVAAAVLIAAAAAFVLARRPGGATLPAPGGVSVQPAALSGEPAHLAEAEREYDRATTELLAALNARRETLSPATVAMVEENLRTIDTALAQIRAALRQDPASPELNHLLTATHQRKVDLLQHVLRLGASL